MTRGGVVADTSVLIAFFRGKAEYVKEIAGLLEGKRLVVTGIILAELLQGMKNLKEEQRISDLLSAISSIELTTDLWIKAGKISLSLRRSGIDLPLTDVAIAALAMEHSLSLFTLDKHFERIPGLKLYKLSD